MPSDQILLEGMIFFGYHGTLAAETELGQRFVVDVELHCNLQAAGQSDELEKTVDYSKVHEQVCAIVEGSPVKLIETVAERIAAAILEQHSLVEAVRVKVAKPHVRLGNTVLRSSAVQIFGSAPMSETRPRPRATVSYAQTLDGRLATRDGISQWISGGESLYFAHSLRAEHDAIMVGVGTVCKDNPRLTVRLVEGRDPLRVVVDSTLRMPHSSAVLAHGAARGTLIATTERAPAERCEAAQALGATVLHLPATGIGQVDLHALIDVLGHRGIRSIMVEGGASLITALLQEKLIDRMAVCIAPKILGAGIEAIGDLGIRSLTDMLELKDVTLQHYGQDWIVTGDVVYPALENKHDAR